MLWCVGYNRGTLVRANWKRRGEYWLGTITAVELDDGGKWQYTIRYLDDGSVEEHVAHTDIIGNPNP